MKCVCLCSLSAPSRERLLSLSDAKEAARAKPNMSHFNLGGPTNRKKFIGPQHRLTMRTTTMTANLENIGGRIMVENEMINHKHRMTHAKPSIDTKLPWAHQLQEEIVRGGSRVSHRLNAATESDRHLNGGDSPVKPAGVRPASTAGRPIRPSTANSVRSNYAVGGGRPKSPRSEAAAAAGGATNSNEPVFHVSMLTADHQQVYREMVRVLCTMSQKDSKALLEEMYRESEDKKLLAAYTGVFPEMA